MKKKIDLLNKLTRQNLTSQDDQEFKKKMMKIMVQKEKFKIDRVPSQSSEESYEFIDSPRRNPVLNYAANKGVVFQEKRKVENLLSKGMLNLNNKATSSKAKFQMKLESETRKILEVHDQIDLKLPPTQQTESSDTDSLTSKEDDLVLENEIKILQQISQKTKK